MLKASIVRDTKELQEILRLQQENLPHQIAVEEMKSQGFVTVQHDLEILEQMHDLAPSIIIKEGDHVVAYALVMLKSYRHLVPVLQPMFAVLDSLEWKGRPLNDYEYYVMGQICIAKEYRGQGLFEKLYLQHRQVYGSNYDFIITEVSFRNTRSMRAHEKAGFQTVHTYKDQTDHWAVLLWDWK